MKKFWFPHVLSNLRSSDFVLGENYTYLHVELGVIPFDSCEKEQQQQQQQK